MSEKTEAPTPKKLRDARKKGDVPYSKDFTQTALILAMVGYMMLGGGHLFRALADLIVSPVPLLGMSFDGALGVLTSHVLREGAQLLAPFLLIAIVLGVLADFLQVGVVFAFEKVKPSGKRLDMVTNLKNIFSKKNLVEFVKSILKVLLLSVLVAWVIRDSLGGLMSIPVTGLDGLGKGMTRLMGAMLFYTGIAYLAIAMADIIWQRKQYTKDQMMTKDEVTREFKEMEGDPHIKQHRKNLHIELLGQEAVANVKQSTVLVTNPTHIAVALWYEAERTPLPVVLAKGEGALAERMIRTAKEAGIPIMQNIPLAHALMGSADVEQYIPSELIEPVAEVLRVVKQLSEDEDSQ
jgi:type III secretion protein U